MAVATERLTAAVEAVITPEEREWVRTQLAPLVGSTATGVGAGRIEMFAAWRTFFEAVAATAPLVLVVEDIHWADDVLVEFLKHLVERASGVPLLILCTARPEVYERHPGWEGGTTVGLAPLSGDQTAELISALLSEMTLPEATRRELLERSGGNPLYAEEFVRMLADRGGVTGDATISVPETVQALIAGRLDTLAAERKALMYDAAVLGRVFWSGGVSTMAARPEIEVRESLHELARKELVRASRSSMEGQAEYAFWHAVVQDVAYRQIPRAARSTKHRHAAEWLATAAGERIGDYAEILAFHYTQALELARSTGSAAEKAELAERAVEFLVASGDRALHLDLEKAGSFYRRALELVTDDDRRRGRVLVKLGWVDSDRGLHEDAERSLEAAIEALGAAGDRVGLGEAHYLLGRTLWRHGEGPRARTLAAEGVKILEAEPPGPERVDAYNEVGRLCMMAAQFDEAIRWAGAAIDGAEALGLRRPLVRALVNRGMSRNHLGDHASGIDGPPGGAAPGAGARHRPRDHADLRQPRLEPGRHGGAGGGARDGERGGGVRAAPRPRLPVGDAQDRPGGVLLQARPLGRGARDHGGVPRVGAHPPGGPDPHAGHAGALAGARPARAGGHGGEAARRAAGGRAQGRRPAGGHPDARAGRPDRVRARGSPTRRSRWRGRSWRPTPPTTACVSWPGRCACSSAAARSTTRGPRRRVSRRPRRGSTRCWRPRAPSWPRPTVTSAAAPPCTARPGRPGRASVTSSSTPTPSWARAGAWSAAAIRTPRRSALAAARDAFAGFGATPLVAEADALLPA